MNISYHATEAQLDAVLADLSPADRREMDASGLTDPRAIFADGLAHAVVSGCVLINGKPVGIFGCSAETEGAGVPWFISTPGFKSEKRPAAQASVAVVRRMRERFPYLHNWVHVRHTSAIRWLTWLGFKVDPTPVGPNADFRHFEWSCNV